MASYNLQDAAQLWCMQVQSEEGTPPWRRFTELLNLRFGPPLRSNPLGELAACKRTGSVVEYQERFEARLARAGTLSEAQKVQLFTAGLQPPLSLDVEIHNPQSLAVAMSLARKVELRDQCAAPAPTPSRTFQRGLLPAPPKQLALPAPPPSTAPPPTPVAPTTTTDGHAIKRLSQAEMEERRRLGLYFNCNEKFGRGHNRVCQRMFLIDFADVDDTDTGETADETTEEPIISVLAISGVRTKETMQLAISIGGASFRALLDSGSTHNFITEDAAARTNLTLAPRGGMRVTVANGERVACPGVYSDTPFVIEGEHFSADFYALPLAGYDIVLGTRWLASLGPILWDFSTLQMAFWHGGRPVRWQGIAGPASPFLAVCDLDHLLRALLDEFPDIFAEPAGMPPPRSQDHRITLVPGAAPVAVRPYRYPAAHKDELERQCTAMLAQGIIRRSTSAFSSPVLLVKKADGSWRFCVDYRALNAITVKDAYPIPVVDELLDEIAGARFFTKLDLRSGYHQVRMYVPDIDKTAFQTHDGLYEFLVMPFGLCNAPATFQALMNDVPTRSSVDSSWSSSMTSSSSATRGPSTSHTSAPSSTRCAATGSSSSVPSARSGRSPSPTWDT
jgi:hypothetical protein